MHPEVVSLLSLLEEAASLLRKHKVDHWANWLERDAQLIRGLDFYGVEHLLSAFGGMGSLNDLALAQPSAENPAILASSPDDSRFQSLLGQIHMLATKLARDERNA